jgi:SET domain-containing protein
MPSLRTTPAEPIRQPATDAGAKVLTLESGPCAGQRRPDSAPPVRGTPADPQKFAVIAGPSRIDGQGAFAAEPIPARRKIGEIRGEAVSTREAFARARAAERSSGRIVVIAVSEHRAIDASASTDVLRFANHSCDPNMVLKVQQGRVAFYALRDIAVGEELTARYGPTHHAGRLACRCGAARCAGRL